MQLVIILHVWSQTRLQRHGFISPIFRVGLHFITEISQIFYSCHRVALKVLSGKRMIKLHFFCILSPKCQPATWRISIIYMYMQPHTFGDNPDRVIKFQNGILASKFQPVIFLIYLAA